MRFMIAAGLSAALVCAASAASADTTAPANVWTAYGTVGYSYLNLNLPSIAGYPSTSAGLSGISVGIDARYGKYVGGELKGTFGVSEATADSVKFKLNSEVHADVVGYLPLSPNADLFAKVGYGHFNFNLSGRGGSDSSSDGAWNVGVGGQYLWGQNGVRVEYLRQTDTNSSNVSIDEVSVGYVRRF